MSKLRTIAIAAFAAAAMAFPAQATDAEKTESATKNDQPNPYARLNGTS